METWHFPAAWIVVLKNRIQVWQLDFLPLLCLNPSLFRASPMTCNFLHLLQSSSTKNVEACASENLDVANLGRPNSKSLPNTPEPEKSIIQNQAKREAWPLGSCSCKRRTLHTNYEHCSIDPAAPPFRKQNQHLTMPGIIRLVS